MFFSAFTAGGIVYRSAQLGPKPLESGFGFRTFKSIRPMEGIGSYGTTVESTNSVMLSLE